MKYDYYERVRSDIVKYCKHSGLDQKIKNREIDVHSFVLSLYDVDQITGGNDYRYCESQEQAKQYLSGNDIVVELMLSQYRDTRNINQHDFINMDSLVRMSLVEDCGYSVFNEFINLEL